MTKKILTTILLTISVSFINVKIKAQAPPPTGGYTQAAEDEIINEPLPTKDSNYIYPVVDTEPVFPGGDSALKKFLNDNIVYPKASLNAKEEGKVYVMFIIERDGRITNIKLLKSTPYERLNNEALRVVNMMPKWKAASNNGYPVRYRYKVVIPFVLPEK